MSNKLNQLILYPDNGGRTGDRNTWVWMIYEKAYVNIVYLLVYYVNLKEPYFQGQHGQQRSNLNDNRCPSPWLGSVGMWGRFLERRESQHVNQSPSRLVGSQERRIGRRGNIQLRSAAVTGSVIHDLCRQQSSILSRLTTVFCVPCGRQRLQ
jgi:hypothetical protein